MANKKGEKRAVWIREYKRRRYDEGLCRSCERPRGRGALCDTHAERARAQVREKAARYWDLVITHYGGCVCCGEETKEFLTIDHVNGNGQEHRKEIGGGGATLARWLVENDFPEDLRLLCFNCNLGRERNGGVCPHERERG